MDDHYDEFLAAVRNRFAARTEPSGKSGKKKKAKPPAVFMTAVGEQLFDLFVAGLPEAMRREHACSTCKAFLRKFGGLVTVDDKGRSHSLLWSPDTTPEPFRESVSALAEAVSQAPITGVFLSDQRLWGVPEKGGWQHLAVTPSEALVCTSVTHGAAQLAAEKREDHRTLTAALEAFPVDLIKRAAGLLRSGSLYRSEKCIEVANWLLELHRTRKSAGSARARENLTWVAVAGAPPGFCHVRSSMIGTLLADLADDLPLEQIKARFDEKMHPLQYQRPTAAPGQQNIERAEKIVAQLRSAGALERRFAQLAEIPTLWRPAAREGVRSGGVFSHVQPRSKKKARELAAETPAVVMTWSKFADAVLPDAASIHYRVPEGKAPLLALITNKHDHAPPIIQWDHPDARNSMTWYFYNGGSLPAHWNLQPSTDHVVSGIALAPPMWAGAGQHEHQGKMVIFLLEGARDLNYLAGSGFFPEFLKHEYREVRATLEAFARSAVIEGASEATACGVGLHASGMWGQCFRVTDTDGITIDYRLDRWD
jgi:hypothetical protein